MSPNDKKLVIQLIEDNQAAKAIEVLKSMFEKNKTGGNQQRTLSAIAARLRKLEDETSRGILTREDQSVAQNRINDDLLRLLLQFEKSNTAKPAPKPKKTAQEKTSTQPPLSTPEPEKPTSGASKWRWLAGLALVAVVAYLVFGNKPPEVQFAKLCFLPDLNGICCPENIDRIQVREANQSLFVSALLSQDLADPSVAGIVYDSFGNIVQQVRLTMSENAICYSGSIEAPQGGGWAPGRYELKFTVNDHPAGSMGFTVIP